MNNKSHKNLREEYQHFFFPLFVMHKETISNVVPLPWESSIYLPKNTCLIIMDLKRERN